MQEKGRYGVELNGAGLCFVPPSGGKETAQGIKWKLNGP